ncbi:hypothetical protein XM57_14190 [Burkholderia cepacia]|nr:hypothetical protein XM57_14190 [Burkholderia cepacia]AYZ98757.1 hypothetical protein EGY28_28340 [Burkholderia dolosa]PRE46334.1 hypothetical protein C6P87_19550 [Burkholderia sp. AU12872]
MSCHDARFESESGGIRVAGCAEPMRPAPSYPAFGVADRRRWRRAHIGRRRDEAGVRASGIARPLHVAERLT